MGKYKMRHYETLKRGLFPQVFPTLKKMGKQKVEEPQMDRNKEPKQPTLDEIWQWFGNPDEY